MGGFTNRSGEVVRATREHPSKRKPHSWWTGYAAERCNTITGDYNVLVDAGEAMMDTSGGRWAVICNAHGTILNHPKQRELRAVLGGLGSLNWCEECRIKACESPNKGWGKDFRNAVRILAGRSPI